MSETILTTEIGKQIAAGLAGYMPAGRFSIYLDGVDSGRLTLPGVGIVCDALSPYAYRSSLWRCMVAIQAATVWADDQSGAVIHEMGQVISLWLMSAPTLALTLAKFDALYFPDASPPKRERQLPDGQVLNVIEWSFEVRGGAITAQLAPI
jgi:hypothetical protein